MATNRVMEPGYQQTVVVTNPAAPVTGDPIRLGVLSGVALTDEGEGGNAATETSVDFGPGVWNLLVDDVGTGIAVGDAIYYHDTQTGTPLTSLNDAPTAADAFFGFALEVVAADATTVIKVLHLAGTV